ncbi:MAG: DUF3105 domain-containing protein, partial [Acidimicrobiales bacterium]|nr:DUF3105 domain-containing protein [Acidimicrobiales bacterium]
RPDRDDIDHQKLHSFSSASVIVAPNKTIESALISTAWTWKLSCEEYDSESLNNFIKDHEGKVSPNHKD